MSPANVAQWLSMDPCTKRSPVQFLVRAHAQIVGQIPSGGHAGGRQSMFSLINVSLSLSLPLSLKSIKNNYLKEKKNAYDLSHRPQHPGLPQVADRTSKFDCPPSSRHNQVSPTQPSRSLTLEATSSGLSLKSKCPDVTIRSYRWARGNYFF
uniref:Uncharacterized protein n=1 Tax=Molossus molossus TaxID=27622 RepID=A0A7J8CZA1_MOLMO|nr:hypothetical protein HJG59_009491 [Molossus molossus]